MALPSDGGGLSTSRNARAAAADSPESRRWGASAAGQKRSKANASADVKLGPICVATLA